MLSHDADAGGAERRWTPRITSPNQRRSDSLWLLMTAEVDDAGGKSLARSAEGLATDGFFEETERGWAVPRSYGVSESARAVLVLIAATMVVRVLFALSLGLGIDESYTVATGRHPQLSYFDHPPLAWWLEWAGGRLFGTEAPLALRAPFIVLFAMTTWLMFSLTRLLFGERAGLWAAVTLNLAPVLAWTSGTWILPDGPLNAALLAGAYCVSVALFVTGSTAPFWWLAAGACGGLAMMAKLHGVFLFAGIGLFLITSPCASSLAGNTMALFDGRSGGGDLPARHHLERTAWTGYLLCSRQNGRALASSSSGRHSLPSPAKPCFCFLGYGYPLSCASPGRFSTVRQRNVNG